MWGPFLILLTLIIILVSLSEKDGLSENSEEELEMLEDEIMLLYDEEEEDLL